MQNHRHRLSSFCSKVDRRAFNECVLVFCAEGQLAAHELSKGHALPMAAAQQGMSVRQGNDAPVEHLQELLCRLGALLRLLRDSGDAREHVLHAMVELCNQERLVVIGLAAFGDVDVDSDHARRLPTVIVSYASSCFDPPYLPIGPDDAKLTDKLRPPVLECVAALGCQSLQIIWMYTSAPILAGDFGCAQWQAKYG